MALDYITTTISLVIFLIYLVVFFILFKVNLSASGRLSSAIIYFRVFVGLLILRRIEILLAQADIFDFSYIEDITALILAIFLLLAFAEFYKAVLEATGRRKSTPKAVAKTASKTKTPKQKPSSITKTGKKTTPDNYLDLTK